MFGKEIIMSDKIEKISESSMEEIGGGVIFNAINISGADRNNPWEVIDDTTGNTLGRFPSREDAINAASANGKNWSEVDWNEVQKLRANHN